jgi:hypothetical protein
MHLRCSGKIFCAQIIVALGLAVPAIGQTLDHFDFSTLTSPKYAYAPFRVLITAKSSTGETVRTFTSTATLQALSENSLALETVEPVKFSSGQWLGTAIIKEPGDSVVLRVSGGGKTGVSSTFDVLATSFRILDLPVISLISDLPRGVLYASVGPTNGPVGTIHVIDPGSGAILDSHFIEGGVERLEMNDDGSNLYVVTDDQLRVRRLSLPDFTKEASFTFGESEPGFPNRARDVAAHPTRPDVFAVVKGRRNLTPWFTGLSVFEGAVEKTTPNVFVAEANVVHWGTDPKRLFGFYNQSTPNNFSVYDLTDTNVNPVVTKWNLFSLFDGDIELAQGRLYCTTGRIVDAETLALIAELPNGHQDALMVPLPAKKRIVFLTPNTLGFMLTFDSDTFQLLATDPWPMPRGYGSGAVAWGENGIAFHDGKRLYLTENAAIPSATGSADLQMSTASPGPIVDINVEQEMSVHLKNSGPNPATAVVVKISGNTDTIFSGGSVTGKNPTVTPIDRGVTLQFDALGTGEEVEVKFTVNSKVPAWQPLSVLATSATLDPNGANNSALVVLRAQPLPTLASNLVLRLGATAMVNDSTHSTLIVAPTATSAPLGGSVIVINPNTGEIKQPVWVGNRPSELAISDDGKFLFIGFAGTPEVRRFTLPDLKLDLTIPLGADGFSGPYFATDISVRPGHPSETAVARSTVSASSTTASNRQFGYFHNATEILPDRGTPFVVRFIDADRLITYDSFGILHWFDVTDQSITWKSILRDLNGGDFPVYHDGKLFFNTGAVYDATTGSRIGQYSFFGPYGPGPIIDGPSKRALVVTRGISEQQISTFDIDTLTPTGGSFVRANIGNLTEMTRWSADGLALSGASGVTIFKPISSADLPMN